MASTTDSTVPLHPEAIAHLPPYLTLPGQTDWLMVATGIFLIATIVGIGVFYLKLHALPEHMAHRGQKIQYEIVSVLALLALFTHNHIFWIAGLLLALIPIPDFTTPMASMADSLGRIARRPGTEGTLAPDRQEPPPPDDKSAPESSGA